MTSFDINSLPAPDWDEMSLFEQMACMPEETQEKLIQDLLRRGIDPFGPDVMMRPEQANMVNDSDSWINLYSSGRGAGKCILFTTPIPTPTGWTTMGELEVGSVIYDEKGYPATVLATYDVLPKRAYTFTFSDNTEMTSGDDHLWTTWTHRDRKAFGRNDALGKFPENWPTWRRSEQNGRPIVPPIGPSVKTTQEIVDTFYQGKRKDLNHCIPLTRPVQGVHQDLLIDPWLLGYWLGNGSASTGVITAGGTKEGVLDIPTVSARLTALGYEHTYRPDGTKNCTTVNTKGLMPQLAGAGLLSNKHIPDQYLLADISQRHALLQGLCDSDGYINPKNQLVEFCAMNKQLAYQVLELVRSLGERPVLSTGRATLNGKDYGEKYRVTWTPVNFNPFTIPRKADVVDLNPRSQGLRRRHRMITSYREVPTEMMRCITVDSRNSLYLAGEAFIPTHNTFTGSAWVNERAEKNPGCLISLVGRTVADVRDVMISGDSGIINKSRKDFVPEYKPSLRKLIWPNGSVATSFSADSPAQLRGPQSHFSWCDELAAYPTKGDDSGLTMWDNVMLSTRLGDNPQILITTTPKRTTLMKELMQMSEVDPRVKMYRGSTLANRSNLSIDYLKAVFNKYAGTHLERQELYGELVGDAEGALWRSDDIIIEDMPDETLQRFVTVIGVDPAIGDNGDNTGIVVVTSDTNPDHYQRRAWVREDLTVDKGGPEKWAHVVVDAWRRYPDSVVVVEGNQGGNAWKMILQQIDPSIPVATVKAISSKVARAEPVVMAYRQGRVRHVADFPDLVGEMTGWEPDRSRYSPGSIDACIVGGTPVLTDQGYVPIEDVQPGVHKVWTRAGWSEVEAAKMTNPSAEVMTVHLSNGEDLTLTPDHKVFTEEKGFVRADALVRGDILSGWLQTPILQKTDTQSLLSITDSLTVETQTLSEAQGESITSPLSGGQATQNYIVKSGLTQMDQSQKDTTFIIETEMLSTTICPIWSVLEHPLTTSNIRTVESTPTIGRIISQRSGHLQQPGTPAMRGSSGIVSMVNRPGKTENLSPSTSDVRIVTKRSKLTFLEKRRRVGIDSVAESVTRRTLIGQGSTTSKSPAQSVERCSYGTSTSPAPKPVPVSVVGFSSVQLRKVAPVYDLQVRDNHEFVAAGVIVHNCVWALMTLLVDPRPLYPFIPIKIANRLSEGMINNAIPSYRASFGTKIGLAVAPWRR